MHPTIAQLLTRVPVITDGAWGTELQARGLPVGACPDLWNLSRPEAVGEVAAAYVAAGSRIVLSNSFGANRVRLAEFDAAGDTVAINHAAVALSRAAAAGHEVLVFAAMGPSGKLLCMDPLAAAELTAAFTEQAAALAAAGADGLVVETMSELEEAVLAVRAAAATGLPVVASMVFDSGQNHDRTMMGTTVAAAAEALTAAGADVIGANCGGGIEEFGSVCEQFLAHSRLPVWLKPNAGVPQLAGGELSYAADPLAFAQSAKQLAAAGAAFIGGCCGTGPAFVRELSRIVGADGVL